MLQETGTSSCCCNVGFYTVGLNERCVEEPVWVDFHHVAGCSERCSQPMWSAPFQSSPKQNSKTTGPYVHTTNTTMYLVEAQLGKIGRCVQSEKRNKMVTVRKRRSELFGVLERDCMKWQRLHCFAWRSYGLVHPAWRGTYQRPAGWSGDSNRLSSTQVSFIKCFTELNITANTSCFSAAVHTAVPRDNTTVMPTDSFWVCVLMFHSAVVLVTSLLTNECKQH